MRRLFMGRERVTRTFDESAYAFIASSDHWNKEEKRTSLEIVWYINSIVYLFVGCYLRKNINIVYIWLLFT